MTSLSWIFGGKKKEDKPTPVTVDAIEVGSDEDYAIINANTSQTGLYPKVQVSPYSPSQFYTPLPYSVLPRIGQQSVTSSTNAKPSVQNQLDGVPFVLSPTLEENSNQNHVKGLEGLRRAVFQIAADINDPVFEYDFKLEHNTLQEASLYRQGN